MRILITGVTGILGNALYRSIKKDGSGFDVFSTRFDITEKEAVARVFTELQPELVVHCAGDGRVDFAEENWEAAFKVNTLGTANILREAGKVEAHVVYISSNAVYDGDSPPYSEDSERRPINYYGKTKVDSERLMFGYQGKGTIIRPILLYGWHPFKARPNLAIRVIESLARKEQIKVVDDIYTQPTYAPDMASAIWGLVLNQKAEKEVYNMAPKEKMTLFKFAGQVARTFELDESLIVPVKSDELKGFAPRPKDTTFDVSKLESLGVKLISAERGLAEMRVDQYAG